LVLLGGGRLGWRDDAAAAAVVEETAAVKPRLVFAPPSREEATTELTDAIERWRTVSIY
jgi:hypothetical protein